MTSAGVSIEVRQRIMALYGGRCAYCRSPLFLLPGTEHIEHIVPRSVGGATDDSNLCLSCPRCNLRKSDRTTAWDRVTRRSVALFHPQRQQWNKHFRWNAKGTRIIGLTASGRATERLLRFNDEEFIRARREWIIAGWHPPGDDPVMK
jgi:hypothetical protein